MQPFFTSNDSDIPQLEGLYIKERNPPATISGANLSKVCIVGETIRGPVGRAVDISSEGRFQEVFGFSNQNDDSGPITNKVWKALLNKPFGALSIVRVAAAGATTATLNLSDVTPTAIIQVDASSPGAWGHVVQVAVEDASDGDSNKFNLKAKYLGREFIYRNIDVHTSGVDNTAAVLGDDDSNLIVLTKLTSGRPLNSSYAALGASSDGSVADSDYTAANKGVNVGATAPGCGVVFVAENMSDAIKGQIYTLSSTVNDRIFVISANASTTSAASAITDAASYRSDRIVYAFNHAYTLDPRTATRILTAPDAWMASILSQVDVDVNPGEEAAKQFTQGISKLYKESFQRADYISFKAAGIAALEKDNGFSFVSGVTTSLDSGKEQITRRRSADYLQLSAASELKHSVKKKNTLSRRLANKGILESFLGDLKFNERIVEQYSIDVEKLNTPTQRAQGIEKILMRVKLIGHMLELVLETEIGTSVVITSN